MSVATNPRLADSGLAGDQHHLAFAMRDPLIRPAVIFKTGVVHQPSTACEESSW
jgi:hypothetical protein